MEVKKAHQLCVQDSGNVELYTDPAIVALAAEVMGGIELDPASCEVANRFVKAERYFTEADDGLNQPWEARSVWMNHPFGKPEEPCKAKCNKKKCQPYDKVKNPKGRGHCITEYIPGNIDWHTKLYNDFIEGNVGEATGICFAELSSAWGRLLLETCHICIPFERINYYDANGVKQSGAPKGSVIYYYGDNADLFVKKFSKVGTVLKAVK